MSDGIIGASGALVRRRCDDGISAYGLVNDSLRGLTLCQMGTPSKRSTFASGRV